LSRKNLSYRGSTDDRETGGFMLNVTGLNHFYYVRDFTDIHCKHSRVLSVIRERLRNEPIDGDVFIVMSHNRSIVRMFSFDNRSCSLFGKKFVAGYQFMEFPGIGEDYDEDDMLFVKKLYMKTQMGD
jgi:transposase